MILIRKIEFEKIPGHRVEIMKMPEFQGYKPERLEKWLNIRTEIIHSRIFSRPDGEEIAIGCTEDVADLIGIQYQAWDNLNEKLSAEMYAHDKLLKTCSDLRAKIVRLENSNLRGRLKSRFSAPVREKRKHSFPLIHWEELKGDNEDPDRFEAEEI